MTNDALPLFNTKSLFHTTATTRRDSFAYRSARRRLARLLAVVCANDAFDDAQTTRIEPEPAAERRAATRD